MNSSKSACIIILCIIYFSFISCQTTIKKNDSFESDKYHKSLEEWKKERIIYLKGHEGWLNLAGLYWLEEGENSVGSDTTNTIQFPAEAPSFLGTFLLYDQKIVFKANPAAQVFNNKEIVTMVVLKPDITMDPTILTYDSLAWFIIQREDQFGVRLRDYNSPEIDKLKSIPCYPVDHGWRIKAEFIPSESKKNNCFAQRTG